MKTKATKSKTLVKVPEEVLLSQIAKNLKGKTLFPHKVAAAREYLQNVKLNTQ
jgi:hypothetical protein